MQDDPYYGLDLISNSRLGVVKNIRDGLPQFSANDKTLDFGKQFHEAILEPERYKFNLDSGNKSYKDNFYKISKMATVARENIIIKMALNSVGVNVEYAHFFNEHRYNLPCKAKFDILTSDKKTIIDLKTTSEKNIYDFKASILKYSYHRQAAFYLDHSDFDGMHISAERFIFVGVTKTLPECKTFTVTYYREGDIAIQEGRKEYEDLIDYYLENKNSIIF